MRTLIRSSQLHPDISGVIRFYSDPNYPNYSDIFGLSGINTYVSGGYLFLGVNDPVKVRSINNLTGAMTISGGSGINTFVTGNNIVLSLTGATSVTSLNSINGNISLVPRGLVDIWPLNSSQIAISGIQITGEGNVVSYYSGGIVRLRGTSIGSLNNKSGELNILGIGGINIINTGQNIYIDGTYAAQSGLHRLNGFGGTSVTITGGNDIQVSTQLLSNNISINYVGRGWGPSNYSFITGINETYIGSFNLIEDNTGVFVNGYNNYVDQNSYVSTINSSNTRIRKCQDSTFINTKGGNHFNLTGSTFINNAVSSGVFRHPYAFGIGMPASNTYYANMQVSTLLSGKEIIKSLRVPKTKYSGIFVPTGSVLMGHIDYVATRYDITDFDASFDMVGGGIYGRKYFLVQRGTNRETFIKDQSDLFGGNGKYSLILSGSNDEVFYLLGSGYSGGNPEDGVDGVHDVLFMANLNFTNFNLHANV